jgi:hypothetical protein
VKRGDADMMRIIGEQLAAESAARQAADEKYARLADDHTDLVKEWAIQVQQLAALRAGVREIICDLHEDRSPLTRMDMAVKRARALLAPHSTRCARSGQAAGHPWRGRRGQRRPTTRAGDRG